MRKPADTPATVRVTHHCASPPARVFDAWLTPSLAGLWLFATASRPIKSVALDARNGGAFCFMERRAGVNIEHRGTYLEISHPHRLAFTLHSPDFSSDPTCVRITIAPAGAGSELQLVHDRLPGDCAARSEARWTGMLYGLNMLLAHCYAEKTY